MDADTNTSDHPLVCFPEASRLGQPVDRSSLSRAVFLDRDGTIVEDVGYLTEPSQLVLLPGAVEGIRLLQEQFLILVVTNQSPVARGLLSRDKLCEIHRSLIDALRARGAFLDAIYVCPHHPEAHCRCRKPEPGMLFQASIDLNVDLASSYMIGDKGSDLLAGQRAGVAATILIPSHQTPSSLKPAITPAWIANDLCEAAQFILGYGPVCS